MSSKNIVIGQSVNLEKILRARELRSRMTPEEKILWQALKTNRLGGLHFRRQQVIDGFIVDFYCHAAGLVVELDGEIHEAQAEYDLERDQALTARALRVLHFKNEQVQENLNEILSKILKACKAS